MSKNIVIYLYASKNIRNSLVLTTIPLKRALIFLLNKIHGKYTTNKTKVLEINHFYTYRFGICENLTLKIKLCSIRPKHSVIYDARFDNEVVLNWNTCKTTIRTRFHDHLAYTGYSVEHHVFENSHLIETD